MENLLDKGRITEAQNHYESYTSMLYKQFGIKPTAELQQVYKMLKSSGAELNDVDAEETYYADEDSAGAFYCDRNTFNSIYVLEKRRSERTGHIVFVVSLTVNENHCIFGEFRKSLVKSLRRGDVVTTWSGNVILVLLPMMEYKQIIAIMDRIIRQFGNESNNYDIKVKILTNLPADI